MLFRLGNSRQDFERRVIMGNGLVEVDTKSWRCLDCGQTGNAEVKVPDKCTNPKCKSVRIKAPPIKKGGPWEEKKTKMY